MTEKYEDHEQYLRFKFGLTTLCPPNVVETPDMTHFINLGSDKSPAIKETIFIVYQQRNKLLSNVLVDNLFSNVAAQKLQGFLDYETINTIQDVYVIQKFYNDLSKTINSLIWFIEEGENYVSIG